MREFRARAIINANASDVFRVLTDSAAHPKFDPNCERIDGAIEHGKRIGFVSRSRISPTTIRITELAAHELSMTWEYGLPFHLLKHVRTFRVIAKDDQTTEVQVREVQSGHLFQFLLRSIPDQSTVLQQLTRGLKKYIEARP